MNVYIMTQIVKTALIIKLNVKKTQVLLVKVLIRGLSQKHIFRWDLTLRFRVFNSKNTEVLSWEMYSFIRIFFKCSVKRQRFCTLVLFNPLRAMDVYIRPYVRLPATTLCLFQQP